MCTIPSQQDVVEGVRKAYARNWLRTSVGQRCSVASADLSWVMPNNYMNAAQVLVEAARAGLVDISYDGGTTVYVLPLGALDRKDAKSVCTGCHQEVAKYYREDGDFVWYSAKNSPHQHDAERPAPCWKTESKLHITKEA